jgi:hypothetical protein
VVGVGGLRLVLFVCPHGAGKSRIAAAWFDASERPGWAATSAGVHPQEEVSVHAPRLLTGTLARDFLDEEAPRPMSAAPDPALVVAIDCPDTVPADVRWELTHQGFDEAMCVELRDRVRALAAALSPESAS